MANKIIEPSKSCYSSPLVPIVKKNKTIRLCADFRLLNNKTLSAQYPIPHADVFNKLGNSKVFSVIDLKNAYHQVKVKEADREKTACVSDNFKFHWIRLPYGLQGAPYTLSTAMNYLLSEHKDCAAAYYDDILVFSMSESEHINHIENILNTLVKHKVRINLEKCEFMKSEVNFLGHRVNEQGLQPLQKNIDDVISFRTPTNVDEIRGFLGKAGFYKKFVPEFAEKAQPLFELLKKKK